MKSTLLVIMFAAIHSSSLLSQPDSARVSPLRQWLSKNERFKPDFKTMVQLWGIWSTGMEVFNNTTKQYEPIDDRFNIYLRRARFMVSGEPYTNLKYTVVFHYDQVGRDVLASGVGGAAGNDPTVGIWDAFFQWKVSKNETLNFVGGWFRPQMQRESITSGWATTSFEKAMSQNYVRTHLVGTGPGRAMGLNMGGLAFLGSEKIGLNYNLGFFNPLINRNLSAPAASKWSPLLVGRVSLSIGGPEITKYSISYETNYFSKRNGVSLDFNISSQGETEIFKSSLAYGPGLLLNYGPLNLDGEWIWMKRDGERQLPSNGIRSFTSVSGTGHIRAGVNVTAGRFIIEPIFMVMYFDGAMDETGQADAAAVKESSGRETTFDAGLNWYLDKKNLKIMLHYTWRNGDPGAAGDGAMVNMYFNQSGVGAIRRGDWLGVGVNAIF